MSRNDFLCERSLAFRAVDAAGEKNDGHTLFGYAAVWGETEISSWEGTFSESIERGAFKKTLREGVPKLQFDHGHDFRTGTVPIGVYQKVEEDSEGLYVEARLFENDLVEPIRQAIEGGAIDGMSIKFRVIRDEWRDKDGKKVKQEELYDLLWRPGDRGPLKRSIKEVKLMEGGPVVFPAYVQTSVGVRAEDDNPFAGLTDEERKQAVVSAYRSRMPEELPVEEPDAVERDTSGEDEEPKDAVRKDTSEGHAKKREVPKSLPQVEKRKESVPMTLEELRDRHAAIVVRCAEMDEEFRDAELPEASQTEWDGLDAERAKIEASIARIEARKSALLDKVEDTSVAVSGAARKKAPAVHIKKDEADLHDVDAVRMDSGGSLEKFAELSRDNALRIAEKLRIPHGHKRDESRERLAELLEGGDTKDAALAQRVMVTASPLYERAFGKAMLALNMAVLSQEEQRALAIGADATGGFAVPVQLDPTIVLTDSLGVSPIRQLSRVVSITGNKWKGITSAGVTVSRDLEAQEVSDDSPTLAQPEVSATRVAGFVPFSYETDQDWGGVRGEIVTMLGRARIKEENASFLTGVGTTVFPQGVLVGATTTVTATGTATFAVGDLYKLEQALPPEFRTGAAWLGNHSTYNLARQFGVSDGHALWERVGAGMPAELLGYPAFEASGMATVLTTGSKILAFGNLKEGYIIVDRIGMSVELIPNLFGAAGRPTGQRGIFAIWRNGAKVINADAIRVLVTG